MEVTLTIQNKGHRVSTLLQITLLLTYKITRLLERTSTATHINTTSKRIQKRQNEIIDTSNTGRRQIHRVSLDTVY